MVLFRHLLEHRFEVGEGDFACTETFAPPELNDAGGHVMGVSERDISDTLKGIRKLRGCSIII